MRISGTAVILSESKYFQKLKRDVPNVPKQTEAKRDGVINTHNYNSNNFNTENLMLSYATNQTKSTVEL